MSRAATLRQGKRRAPGDVAGEPLGEVLEFMRVLWSIDHGLNSMSKRMATSVGVTGPQRLALRLVGRAPGITAGELAVILHIDPSTMSGVLHRLEDRALIVRRPDPNDKRRALLALTAKGTRLDGLRSGTVEARVKAALAGVPTSRVRAAHELLSSIAAALARPTR
jgi:DNA-binding MarR family transcriptional regulator